MTHLSRRQPATLRDLGLDRLRALGRALNLRASDLSSAKAVFERLAVGWAATPLGTPPRSACDITDDHTPFEFSLAIDDGVPELRILSEAQAEVPSVAANWQASLQLNQRLAVDFGANLARFSKIADLFAPTRSCRRFSLWHAACLTAGGDPEFKVYLNPQAAGAARAPELVKQAMDRLGFATAFEQLPELGAGDELCYFSLDLARTASARVKLYTAHYRADLERIERAVSTADGSTPARAAAFCRAMAGDSGPYRSRPVLTCLSFVEGSVRPSAATVHFPVRSYAASDADVKARLSKHLSKQAGAIHARAVEAFARRALAERSGIQTYASLRLDVNHERVTVYLAPEAYATPVGSPPSRARSRSLEQAL